MPSPNEAYKGLGTLNDAFKKNPALGRSVVDRYRNLMAGGASKDMLASEAKMMGFAPIIDYGNGQTEDMTDFLSQQAPRTFAEGVQDTTMGVGRGLLSIAPDTLSLGGLALRQFGYEGLSQYAEDVREGVNEFLPMSNEYRASRKAESIFDLNPSAIGQGAGSIGGMFLGGGLLKGGAKATSMLTGGRVGAAMAKAPVFAPAVKGATSPAVKAGMIMGAGSAAEQARQEGATPLQSIAPAIGGAVGGYLEKFGTERLVSKIIGGKAAAVKITKDATGKFIFPKASQLPGFTRTAAVSLGAETLEEQAASAALELGRTSYAKEGLGERLVQGQIETLATAPYAIGPLSGYAGIRASALKGRVGAAERMFTERGKSIFNLDGVGDKPVARSYVDPKAVSAEDRAALDSMNATSGGNLVVSSASHEGLNDMARRVADSGMRVVFVGQAPTAAEAGAEAEAKPGVAGFFDHKSNTLYINSDIAPEQQVIFGLTHETIHRLAKSEPTGIQGLFDRVSSVFGKQFTDYAEALQKRYESAGVMDPATLTEEGFANFLTQALYGYTAAALTDENEMRMLALSDYGMFTDIANVFGGWASTLIGKPSSVKYDRQLADRLAAAVQNLNQSAGVTGEQGIEVSGETAARDFSFAREFIESMQKMLGDSGTQMESIRRAAADVLSERDAMSESFMLSELADRLGVSIPEAKDLYEKATANVPLTAGQIDTKNQAIVDAAKLEETKAAEAAELATRTAEEAAAAEAKTKADQEEAERQTQRDEVVNALVLANKLASKLGVDPVDLLDKNIRSMTTVDDEKLDLLGKNKAITDAELAGLQAARAAWARSGDAVRTGDELEAQRKRAEAIEAFDRTELERRARRSRRTPAEVMEQAAQEARKAEAEKKRVADEAAAAKKKAEEDKAAAKKKKDEDAAAEKQRREADREAAKKTAEGKRAIAKARSVYEGVMRDYATAKRRVEAATKANNTKQLPKLQTDANELALKAKEAADAYEALSGEKLAVPELAAAPAPAAPAAPAAGTTAPPAPATPAAPTAPTAQRPDPTGPLTYKELKQLYADVMSRAATLDDRYFLSAAQQSVATVRPYLDMKSKYESELKSPNPRRGTKARLSETNATIKRLSDQYREAYNRDLLQDVKIQEEPDASQAVSGTVTVQQLEDLANPSKTTDEQLDAAIKANKQLSDALEGVEPSMRRNILYAHAQQMKNGGSFSLLFNATVETEKLADIKKLAVGDKLGILAANKVVAGIVRRFLPQTKTNYGYGIFDGGVERSMAMDVETEDADEARRAMLGIFGPFGFRQYAVYEIDTSWKQDARNPVPIGQPIPGKEGYYAQQMHEIRGRITLPAQDIANEAKNLGVIGLSVLPNRAFSYTNSYITDKQGRNELAANWRKLYEWIRDEQDKLGQGTGLQVASRPIALRENSAASAANERQSPYETNSISNWWTANKGTVEAGLTGKQLSKLDLAKEPTGPFSLLFQPGEKRSTYKPQTQGAREFGAVQSAINAAFDGTEPQFIKNPTKTSPLAGGKVRTIAQYFRSLMNDKDVIDYRKAYPRGVKAKEIDQAVYDDMVKRGSERMVDVIRHAIHEFPQWTTWYKTRLEMALNIFADIDPEAATPESQFHLKLLLALTSNGEKVDSNTVMTWDAYSTWLEMKRQGLEPKLANRGVTGARDIKDSLGKADSMIKERGWEYVQRFLDQSGPRSELIKNLSIEFPNTFPATFTEAEGTYDASKAANGELVTEVIPYASMFGPKLGSFYNNLNGKFDTTTMDRWFMRTFGRTMGNQLKDAGPASARSRQRFLDSWDKLNKQDVAAILAEVKMDGTESPEELASAISKRMGVNKTFRLGWSRKGSARDEFRKSSNAYAKVADGVDMLEAPENGPHRRFIRNVMSAAVAEMKNKYGWESSPAEVQALLWYYEKELHNEWESGETENPDYATGANKVFRIVDADKNAAQSGFVPRDAKSFAESGLESRRDAERPEYIAKVKAAEAEKVLDKQRLEADRVAREEKAKSDIAAGKVELRDLAKLHSQAVAINDAKGAMDLVKKAAAIAGKTRVVVVDQLQASDVDRMINGMTVLRYAELDADGQIIPLNKRFAPDVANRQALNAVKKAIKSGDVRGMSLAKTGIVTTEEESAYNGAISAEEFNLAERLAQTILARVGITTPAVDAMYDKDGNPVSVNRLAIRAQEVSEAAKKAAKTIYRASGGESGKFSLLPEQAEMDRKHREAVESGKMTVAKRMVMDAMRSAGWVVNALPGMVKKDQTFYHGTALGRFVELRPKLKAAVERLTAREDDAREALRQRYESQHEEREELQELRYWWNKADRRVMDQIPRELKDLQEYDYKYDRVFITDDEKFEDLQSEQKELRKLRSALSVEISKIEREIGEGSERESLPDRYSPFAKEVSKVQDELLFAKVLLNRTAPDDVDAFSGKMIGKSTDAGWYGPGFYFTQTKEYAEEYANRTMARLPEGVKKSPFVYEVAIKMNKPYYMGHDGMAEKNDIAIPGMFGGGDNLMDRGSYRELEAAGYDGIIIQELANNKTREFVVWNPNRVKSVEAATYDKEGKLIPLSQRFNEQNPDVRYSLLPTMPWFKNGISKTDPLDFTGVDDPSTGWFVKQFADYMQPIRAVAKSIEKVAMESGGKLAQWSESMDVSARLDMYRNLTAEYMNQGKEFIDGVSAAMAEGNIPVSRQAGDEAGNSNVSVDEYLIARHAQRRNSVMLQDLLNKDKQYSSAVASGNLAAAAKRKSDMIAANKSRMAAQKTGGMPVEADITMLSGMSDADAAAILAKAKSPAYQKVSDAMRLIQKRKLQVAVMSGLLSKEQADSWRRKYGEDYVPLKTTILDPNEQFLGGSGFVVRGPESKKAKGRSTMADDIAGHAVVDYSAMVSRGMKNMVGQAFYSMAAANPNDAWTLYDSRDEVPVESLARIFVTKFNGEEKLMTINSAEMVRAMKNMDMADMGRGLAVASAASRAFTKLQTAWSPAFIAPNFVRDLGLALTITSVDETVASAVRVAKNIPSAVATIFAEQFGRAPGKLDRYYREMKQQGALTGYSNYYSVSDAAAALQLEAKKLRDGESMPVSYLKGLAGFMEKLNAVAERSTRLAVYAEARERGMSQLKAAEVAVNITVNFSRRGNATPVMNTLYPFFNANIQGTSNLARRMFWSESATPRQKKRMTAAIAAATAMGYMFSAIARGMGGDDEEGEEAYKNVPEYDLTRNLVLMKPDGSGDRYLLPLPWGVNLAFFAGVQSERMVKGDESAAESTGRVLKSSFESLSPINGATWTQTISPTLVDPIVQIAENQNFAGAKIMPDRNPFDKTPSPDSQLKFKSVNPAAAYVAEAINEITGGSTRKPGLVDVSPESIEHITKFMGGGAGSFGYGVLSGFTKAAVSEEEMGIEEVPAVGAVAGRFLTEEDPARKTKTEFFENMKAYAVYREDLEDKETRGEARKSKLRTLDAYTTQVDSKLRDLRKRQLAAKSDATAKRIEQQSLDIMRRYNQRYNRLAQLDAQ